MRKNVAQNSFLLTLVFCLLIFAGCDCDENSYNAISPTPLPRADKELIIEGPLPDVAAGGGVSFSPGAPSRAAEFGAHYVMAIIDRDDPTQTRELAPVAIEGNAYKAVIPISDSRMSPLIVIKKKENNQNLLLAIPGKVPAYQEVPEKVRQIVVRGMIIDPKSTARSLLAIAKNLNPDIPMVTIAPEEETLENVIREIITGETSRFDTIIENNVGGAAIVKEFSKAVQTVTVILSSEKVAEELKNGLNQTLGGTPDAVSVLAAYVTVLNSDDAVIINTLDTAQLPRSVQLSETVIDARTSGNAIKNVIQNTIDEPADKTAPVIEYASISPSIVKSGDTIFLEFRASEPLACSPLVRILGRTAPAVALNDLSYAASIKVSESDTLSEAGFVITEIYDRYGNKGESASRTTDGSTSKIDRTLAVTAPEISIPGGSYDSTISVSLKSAVENATIKYTLDGSQPSANNGYVYNGSIAVSQSLTLKAVAMLGVSVSGVSCAAYVIKIPLPKASAPVFDPVGSTYYSTQSVTLSSATFGATIKYTIDGTKPSETSGITYNGPFEVAASLKVLAVAFKDGMEISEHSVAVYTIEPPREKAGKPLITPASGLYDATVEVKIETATAVAIIYYTLDGTEPSAAKGLLYGGPINISSRAVVSAVAVKSGMLDSEIAAETYTFLTAVEAPAFSLKEGVYTGTQSVALTTATAVAIIYYTLDGSAPSAASATLYSGTIEVHSNVTIKAIAVKEGMKVSQAAVSRYTIVVPETVAAPVFKPAGGEVYTSTQQVEISCATSGAIIYYTLDGGAPTRNSLKYESPVTISKTATIRAFAVKDGMVDSAVKEAQYPIHFPAAEPAFSIAGGTYSSTFEVAITTATEGAKIYYTLDGTEPSEANGTLYSSPLPVTKPLNIKAVAVKDGMSCSNVIGSSYEVPTEMVCAPLVSPDGGYFFSQTKVTITCATADAEIYYTLDGGAPSKLSTGYTAPFYINKFGQFKVKAVAYKAGMFDSQVAESAVFTITVPPLPQADLTKVQIGKMDGENKLCLKNVTNSMEYSTDATGATAGVTWQTGTGADIPLESTAAPKLGAPKANAPSYGLGPDTSPYIVVRDKNYKNRLRGLGRYNSRPLSNSSSTAQSWSLDALSAKIVYGKPYYGNSADFKLYLYVGTSAANGTPVGSGYQLGEVAAGTRSSIQIPSSDKASWTTADYASFYLKNDNNTSDETSDDYYYAICTPVKVSAGPDMVNNTAAALVNAADGGAFAPAGIVNTDGGNKGVTLRPGLSISANESVILKVSKTNTILAEAFSSADGVTPVFGGGTANVTYSGDVVADSGGKLNFKVDSRAIGAGEVSVAAAKKDANANISLAGAPVVINYSVTQPAAPSNIGFAGLNNNSGTISLEPGKSIGAGTGTIIIYTDNDGIFDSTNTIAQAKTAAGQNLAAAGASYSLAKTMAGADYTWSPATFAGKFIGYALLDEATGNLSAVSFGGSVPAAPSGANYSEGDLALLNLEYQDASNLKLKSSGNLSQADMKVLATANGGANWYELGVTDAANAFSASGNNLPVAQYTASSAVRYAFKNAAGNVSQASNQDGEVVTVSKFGTGNIAIGNDRAITVYFTGSGAKVLANIADAQNIVTISTVKSGAAITFGTGAGDFAKDASGTSISMNIDVSVHALDRAEPNCAWKAHADANNIVSLNGGHAVAPASGLKGSFIQWTAMGSGTDNGVLKLITAPDGTIYVAGQFTTANGASANHVAKYSNGNWSTFVDSGTSVNGITGGNAHALAYDSANGILYVGGDYSQAGGKAIPWLAKWSNATSTWSAVGVPADGPDNFVRSLFLTPDGKFLYAGGYFNSSGKKFIMKYDITNNVWTQVGGGNNGGVFAMAYDQASNSIYVGGEFSECYNSGSAVNVGSPRAAKWNITNDTWEPLGEGLTFRDVKSIAIGTGGAVYYGGIYSGGGGGYLKKWNATSWSNVGSVNEEVKALLFDSVNSILYVGGCFSSPDGVSTMNKIALYDPAANTWSNAGAGMNQGIYTLTLDADGTIYAGGDFTSAGEVTNGDTIMNHISKR